MASFSFTEKNEIRTIPPNCDSVLIVRNIYFALSSDSILLDRSISGLMEISNLISRCSGHYEVSVHFDQRARIGAVDLSALRARQLRFTLIKLGVEEYRITAVGKHSNYPIILNPQSEEEYAVNRRIEIRRLE